MPASTAFFLAAIEKIDGLIGGLRGALAGENLERDTILIFMTDNGGPRAAGVMPPRVPFPGPCRGVAAFRLTSGSPCTIHASIALCAGRTPVDGSVGRQDPTESDP